MAVTDLTGTKWLLKDTVNSTWEAQNQYYYINFTSNNVEYSYIFISEYDEVIVKYNYSNTEVKVYDSSAGRWQNEAYRTIYITGGTDVTNTYTIRWLQENARQVMPIADLTGTKWYFDASISMPSTSLNLDFYSNGLMHDRIYSGSPSIMYYDTIDNPNSKVIDDGWTDQAYRFIGITGGTDVTSQTAISWLQSNATLLPVINLTGTTWLFNETISTFESVTFSIDFTCNNVQYTFMDFDFRSRFYYGNTLVYSSSSSGSWISDIYHTITFTGGSDATNLDLIVWLAQNATYQGTSSGFQSYQICLKLPLGAYTLTWDSGITVMVSGSSVSQGYELQDGDIILATVDSSLGTVYAVINSITYNAPADISLDDTNIHISYYLQGSGGSIN